MSSHDVRLSRELLCHCLTSAGHDSRDVTSQQNRVTSGCGTNAAACPSQLRQAGEALSAINTCPGQGAPVTRGQHTVALHGGSLTHPTPPQQALSCWFCQSPWGTGCPQLFQRDGSEGKGFIPSPSYFRPHSKIISVLSITYPLPWHEDCLFLKQVLPKNKLNFPPLLGPVRAFISVISVLTDDLRKMHL